MCGRFTSTTPADVLVEELGLEAVAREYRPRFNIAPTQLVPVVVDAEAPRLELFRWGLIPSWSRGPRPGTSLINARAETVATKPSFRAAYRKRRCLVVADGFYEWARRGGRKVPMYIRLRSQRPFAFAGLWERWQAPGGELVRSCVIITTAPNATLEPIHDRMPVILTPAGRAAWLDPRAADPSALLVPCDDAALEAFAVSTLVNQPGNDVPDCIRPVPATGTLPLFGDEPPD